MNPHPGNPDNASSGLCDWSLWPRLSAVHADIQRATAQAARHVEEARLTLERARLMDQATKAQSMRELRSAAARPDKGGTASRERRR